MARHLVPDFRRGDRRLSVVVRADRHSQPPGPPDQASIAKLSSYQSGLYGVSASTPVLSLELEIDNWVAQSEAYVDDIAISLA